MAPPGRRRSSISIPHFVIFAFVLLSNFIQGVIAQSAVLGLDIGTEYIKAALVKPGIPLDIVLTKDSKRKEAAVIGFKPNPISQDAGQLPERLYGGDALAVAARFPADVYPNLKPLLGSALDIQSTLETYTRRLPDLSVKADDTTGHKPSFKSRSEQEPFSVEELLAMEMVSIKHNAEAMAGSGLAIRNAVITVPTFYTVDERRAIQLAAELAGLNVMSLLSDGLAVGLNYATSRSFPNIDKGEKAEYHLVYDMGAGSTTSTVLKFQARTVKDVGKFNKTIQEVNVIGTGWDRTLGGDALNEVIVNDMVTKFAETKVAKASNVEVIQVRSHGKTMAKLWKEAERLRQVLSANSVTVANLESLHDDIDFKYKLSRSELETMAAPFASRVAKPLLDALVAAKISITDLDSIVLHGGMVRTPLVQKELEGQVGNPAKLRSNVNADEAAVFGAAFKAAGLSPSFRVKDIKSNDAANYASKISWTSKEKSRHQQVFVPTSQAGVVKQIPMNMSEDFSLKLSQDIPSQSSGSISERDIAEVKVANLSASVAELEKFGCIRTEIKTVLSMRLDPILGIPEVSAGSVSCEVDPAGKKGGVVDDVKGFFGFGGKKEQEPLGEGESSLSETATAKLESTVPESSMSATASSSSSAPVSSTSSSSKGKKKEAAAPQKKTKVINLSLEISRKDDCQPQQTQLTSMKDRLLAFENSDASRRQREEAFNALEASVYRARDMLTDEPFMEVSSVEQRDEISSLLVTLSDWLHGDGSSATIDTIKEQKVSLKALVDPVLKRKGEKAERPRAIESLESALNSTGSMVQTIREAIDKAAEFAAEAASSAKDEISSGDEPPPSSSAETETPGPGATPLEHNPDDLEDAVTPSQTTDTASSTPSPSELPFGLPKYTEADYESLSSIHASGKSWLTDQRSAQDALRDSDEPILTLKALRSKTKEIEEATQSLIMRNFDFANVPGFDKLKDMPGFESIFGAKGGAGGKGSKAGSSGAKKTQSSKKSKSKKSKTSASVKASTAQEPVVPESDTPQPETPVGESHIEL